LLMPHNKGNVDKEDVIQSCDHRAQRAADHVVELDIVLVNIVVRAEALETRDQVPG